MSLLHLLMGPRTGRRGIRDGSGMLLVMLALSGLLANKAARKDKGPGQRLTEQRPGRIRLQDPSNDVRSPIDRFGSR
jgi:hypothetical protein